MPSTHLSLHYHIVFSTKEPPPIIIPAWRERLHAYLGGIVRNLGGVAEAVGGVEDHANLASSALSEGFRMAWLVEHRETRKSEREVRVSLTEW